MANQFDTFEDAEGTGTGKLTGHGNGTSPHLASDYGNKRMNQDWFVYIKDEQQGPFSMEKLKSIALRGDITPDSPVWCEGMGDWKQIKDIPDLQTLFDKDAGAAPPEMKDKARTPLFTKSAQARPEQPTKEKVRATDDLSAFISLKPGDVDDNTKNLDPVAVRNAKKEAALAVKAARIGMKKFEIEHRDDSAKGKALALLVVLLVISGAGGAYLGSLGKLGPLQPVLDKYWSPIQLPKDMDLQDQQELRAAARATQPPGVAVAALNPSSALPSMVVVAALPDNTDLEVYVHGVPGTLVDSAGVDFKLPIKIIKKIGSLSSIKDPSGSALPMGEYQVAVTENEKQEGLAATFLGALSPTTANLPAFLPKGHKIAVTKTVFLGGKKDAQYETLLKGYQAKLAADKLASIQQLGALADRLEAQLKAILSTGAALDKMPQRNRKKAWLQAHDAWTNSQSQLNTEFYQWTGAGIGKEPAFAELSESARGALLAVTHAHDVYHAVLAPVPPPAGTQSMPKSSELDNVKNEKEAVEQASGLLAQLRSKIESASKEVK